MQIISILNINISVLSCTLCNTAFVEMIWYTFVLPVFLDNIKDILKKVFKSINIFKYSRVCISWSIITNKSCYFNYKYYISDHTCNAIISVKYKRRTMLYFCNRALQANSCCNYLWLSVSNIVILILILSDCLNVIWFAKIDQFCQNICDLICKKNYW